MNVQTSRIESPLTSELHDELELIQNLGVRPRAAATPRDVLRPIQARFNEKKRELAVLQKLAATIFTTPRPVLGSYIRCLEQFIDDPELETLHQLENYICSISLPNALKEEFISENLKTFEILSKTLEEACAT